VVFHGRLPSGPLLGKPDIQHGCFELIMKEETTDDIMIHDDKPEKQSIFSIFPTTNSRSKCLSFSGQEDRDRDEECGVIFKRLSGNEITDI
jgi:hypothetical protein